MRPATTHRPARRGAEAVEFALVMPVLLTLVFGGVDYGWFYLQQSLATNAVMTGMRAGGLTSPTEGEAGTGACENCVSNAGARAVQELARWGISADAQDLEPTIVGVSGVCMMVLDVNLPSQSILGLVPVPDHYRVSVAQSAQAVKGCDA